MFVFLFKLLDPGMENLSEKDAIRISKAVKSHSEQGIIKMYINICRRWKEQMCSQVIQALCPCI